MASGDNPRLPLTSGASSIFKYTEMRSPSETPSTTITMAPISSPEASSNVTSPKTRKRFGNIAVEAYELHANSVQYRRVIKKELMGNVGYRLAKRKELHIRR